MDALYNMQMDLFKQIDNSFVNFKKKGAAKMSRITAQARLSGLEDCYSQYKSIHSKILAIKDLPQGHEYFSSNVSERILDAFYDRKGEFLQFIEDNKQPPPESPPPQRNLNASVVSASLEAHSLPKMTLPKFSGKFTEWENFRDLFRSVVHRRNHLDPSIKYYHLRTNLSGDAMEVIKSIPIAADQYEIAWTALLAYYDNKRRTVNTLVTSILNIKAMKLESESELKRVNRELFGPIESLKKLGRSEVDIGNDLLVHIAVELFDDFIKGQIENLDEGKDLQSSSSKNKNVKGKTSKGEGEVSTVHSLQTLSKYSPQKSAKCILCYSEHMLSKCDQFLKKNVGERRELAKSKRLCFNCLGSSHAQNRCRSKYSCFTCRKRHHTLMHQDNPVVETNSSSTSEQSDVEQSTLNTNCLNLGKSEITTTHTTNSFKGAGVLLATALMRVIGPGNRQQIVRALIDPCSQISLVTEKLCNLLSLVQAGASMSVQGVGEQNALRANKVAHLHLEPHFSSSFWLETKALVLPRISSYKPPIVQSSVPLDYLDGLQLADPSYLEHLRIELLLGADVYASIIEEKIVKSSVNQPMAIQSKFGWLLTGKISDLSTVSLSQERRIITLHCISHSDQETQLTDLLREFWRTEEPPSFKNSRSAEDEHCEKLFVETTSRDHTGRYTVALPWKDPKTRDEIQIGNSYSAALRALKRLESNFQKDKRLEVEYTKFMREYLELGHMTEIDEVPSSTSNFVFLPHHGVWKENSSTTKLRTVFNGSNKLYTGESLNDLLYSGPNLLLKPVDLICNSRNFKIALSADVEKMFRMIGIVPKDRKFQAILWRFGPQKKIKIFVLNTVTYGLTCSLYLSLRTLLQMANDYEKEYPKAVAIIREDMYSDNVLTGAHTTTETEEIVNELVSLFAKAQMNLRKWSSNEPLALATLPESKLVDNRITLFNTNYFTPIMGIAWHTQGDYYCFHLEDLVIIRPATKRNVLSRVARTFDPVGWISPVIILAKILLQSLWLQKVNWDEPLPADIAQQWFDWLQELPALREIRIPRWTGYVPGTTVELHGFADASKKAFGTVLYLRIISSSQVLTSLQLAKSKVEPIKTLSIPRLELCATLLLVRLAKHFVDSSKIDICSVHLWTDSADVLFWLKDHPSRWNVFVANRCSEIHSSLPHAFWHHVRSKDNPADVLSRGVQPSKFRDDVLWWKGPAVLTE